MTSTARVANKRTRPKAKGRVLEFDKLLKKISRQYGKRLALSWVAAVRKYQKTINVSALESALVSGNLAAIESVVSAARMQMTIERALRGPMLGAAQSTGRVSEQILRSQGVQIAFDATHPNVILFARERAAQMVQDVPKQVKQIIAEIIARGAEGRLTVGEQAIAIREAVGLPPNWANAPRALAEEIRAGEISAATSRRLSAATKQRIRSAIRRGTVTDAFVRSVTEEYTDSLIHARALTIARTESLRAAHYGLLESWQQGQLQGVLPPQVRRWWIVTPDERLSPEHARIPGMNQAGRGLREPFMTPDGPFMYPPTRPNCRCSVALSFPRT